MGCYHGKASSKDLQAQGELPYGVSNGVLPQRKVGRTETPYLYHQFPSIPEFEGENEEYSFETADDMISKKNPIETQTSSVTTEPKSRPSLRRRSSLYGLGENESIPSLLKQHEKNSVESNDPSSRRRSSSFGTTDDLSSVFTSHPPFQRSFSFSSPNGQSGQRRQDRRRSSLYGLEQDAGIPTLVPIPFSNGSAFQNGNLPRRSLQQRQSFSSSVASRRTSSVSQASSSSAKRDRKNSMTSRQSMYGLSEEDHVPPVSECGKISDHVPEVDIDDIIGKKSKPRKISNSESSANGVVKFSVGRRERDADEEYRNRKANRLAGVPTNKPLRV